MKNIHTKISALLISSLVAASLSGCSLSINMNGSSEASAALGENESSIAESDVSRDESSDNETDESTEESVASSDAEASEESTEGSEMTESEALEVSIDGYQFDDEQIVRDYHTAKEFTKNEAFNEIFKTNAIDAEFDKELRKAMSVVDMRNVTKTYMQKWEAEVDVAYNALKNKLADNSEALSQLEQSQQDWIDSASAAEESFAEEASGAGSEGILAADTAMMNYYKGRTAVLLEQIYELDGEINLADYGL